MYKLREDKSWSYSDRTNHNTSYLTHNYYTYPAKFIPQVASRLIQENSNEGDTIIDPFMGSGTTIVEALLNNRLGIGTDINYVAFLVAKAKTTPINHKFLEEEILKLHSDLDHRMNGKFDYYLMKSYRFIPKNDRIDYWFKKQQKEKLSIILARINEVQNIAIKNLFSVAFAQILKHCSIWLQSSVKPQRDLKKEIYDPLELFLSRVKNMSKRNESFIQKLKPEIIHSINKYRKIVRNDARRIPCADNIATAIITSPPYVTSYEYADLHQLPALWFNKMNNLDSFRRHFIGSEFNKEENDIDLHSRTADKMIEDLKAHRKSKAIRKYYFEMYECFTEMKRVLKKNGKACIVIGDTQYRNVDILNHLVFIEQLNHLRFEIENVTLRQVTFKMLPSFRDSKSGRFTNVASKNVKLVHPKEYIIIAKKN